LRSAHRPDVRSSRRLRTARCSASRPTLRDGTHARRRARGALRPHDRRRFHRGDVTAGGLVRAGARPDIQHGLRIAECGPDLGGDPRLGRGEVLIRVTAAGVNFADISLARGTFVGGPQPLRSYFQYVLGHNGIDFQLPLVVYLFVASIGTDYNILIISSVLLSAFINAFLLVPALTVLAGQAAWWPSTPTCPHRPGGCGWGSVRVAHLATPHLAGRDKANRVVVPGTPGARSAGCVGAGRGRRLPGGALDDLLCHPV
jgi:hypothetical protein